MMFLLAHDLTFPFEEGIKTIPITQELASLSAELLGLCSNRSDEDDQYEVDRSEDHDQGESTSLVNRSDSPLVAQWPTVPRSAYGTISTIHASSVESEEASVRRVSWYGRSRAVGVPLIVFAIWSFAVTLYTYNIAPTPAPGEVCRWWCVHLPLSDSVVSYISLGLFLLLSFWLNSAYKHYESGVFLWNVQVRRRISELAVLFSRLLAPEDRPRALAHLSAVPFVAGAWLRDSSDLSSLESVLAPKDFNSLKASSEPITYTLSVLSEYAYGVPRSCGNAVHALSEATLALEQTIIDCQAIKKVPVPQPYTIHLALFITVWLGLLPFNAVQQLGFFAVIVLLPVAYSVIKLFNIGCEMTDPFGTDLHDIPVIPIAHEMRAIVKQTYLDLCSNSPSESEEEANGRESDARSHDFGHSDTERLADNGSVVESEQEADEVAGNLDESKNGEDYPSSRFMATPTMSGLRERPDVTPSVRKSLGDIVRALPSVSTFPLVLVTIWTVSAVFISRALSSLWNPFTADICRNWCSPVDIDTGTLANIGFALFTILAFRAADAISRYENGASLLYELRTQLRSLAVELSLIAGPDSAELRRVVAHLSQVPLSLRDNLLVIVRSEGSNESLLSDKDWKAVCRHPRPVDYLLGVVENFVLELNADACKDIESFEPIHPATDRIINLERVNRVREMVETAFNVKRFPVIPSYTQHQRVFTALWLFLLPLSMTADLGWYTILWAPLIAYAVFGLETISNKLVDPFGTDDIDIPVDDLCRRASSAVLDGVCSVHWGSVRLPERFEQPPLTGFGISVEGSRIHNKFALPRLKSSQNGEEPGKKDLAVTFSSSVEAKVEPTLYAHFSHSVPWSAITAVSCWALIAVVLSYVTRELGTETRWWSSRLSVSSDVAGYVSFGGAYIEPSNFQFPILVL